MLGPSLLVGAGLALSFGAVTIASVSGVPYDRQGLLFLAYQSDPRTSFVPVQQRLAASDALNPFTSAVGSGVFAVLPGTTDPAHWLGRRLLTQAR